MSRKVSALESLLHNGDIEKVLSTNLTGESETASSTTSLIHGQQEAIKENQIDDSLQTQAAIDNQQAETAVTIDKDPNLRASEPKTVTPKRKKSSSVSQKEIIEGALTTHAVDQVIPETTLLFIKPSTIRPWHFADRPTNEISGIEELADDIKHNGQSTPILVRSLPAAEGQIKYEYIFGCRRLAACQLAGIDVRAIVATKEQLSDNRAFALMFGENEQRENISSWARSISFQQVLSEGIYKSKRELSLAIGRNESYIKNLTIYGKIPLALSKAIGPMTKVSINTAQTIESLSRDPDNIPKLVDIADKISDGMSPKSLRDKILGRSARSTSQRYNGKKGATLCFTQTNDGNINIKLSSSDNKTNNFDQLAELLLSYLEEDNNQ